MKISSVFKHNAHTHIRFWYKFLPVVGLVKHILLICTVGWILHDIACIHQPSKIDKTPWILALNINNFGLYLIKKQLNFSILQFLSCFSFLNTFICRYHKKSIFHDSRQSKQIIEGLLTHQITLLNHLDVCLSVCLFVIVLLQNDLSDGKLKS